MLSKFFDEFKERAAKKTLPYNPMETVEDIKDFLLVMKESNTGKTKKDENLRLMINRALMKIGQTGTSTDEVLKNLLQLTLNLDGLGSRWAASTIDEIAIHKKMKTLYKIQGRFGEFNSIVNNVRNGLYISAEERTVLQKTLQ